MSTRKLILLVILSIFSISPYILNGLSNNAIKSHYLIFDKNLCINSNLDSIVRIDKKICVLGEPRSQGHDDLTEKKFDLHGKIWVIKVILNDTINNFMLDIFCNTSITHKTKGHLDLIDCLYIKKDSWNYTKFTTISLRFIPTIIPPTYLHYHNNFFSFTKDKLEIALQRGLLSNIEIKWEPSSPLEKGVYHFILGSQAFTINNSFYTVEHYIRFLYPENCNINFETYKQSDPIGVSFSEMNASYINLYEGISGYCFFKNGACIFKPKHSLFLQFTHPIYLPIYKRGYFDITIGDQHYIANKWKDKTHGDEFPWWVITSDKPLPVYINYSEIGENSSPLNLIALDVELP